MGIFFRLRAFRRGISLLLAILVICSMVLSSVPVTTVSASGWNGWNGMNTIAILPASNVYLNTASQELKTYLGRMSGRSWTIVQGDVPGLAVRLDVKPTASEFTGRTDEAVRILSDATGIRITGKSPIAARHGAYILLEKLGVRWFFKSSAWEVVPPSLADPGVFDEVDEPSFFWRDLEFWPMVDATKTADWTARNRLYGAKFYFAGEDYAKIIPITEFSSHPEYFVPQGMTASTRPFQLKTDNPDVVARAKQFARTEAAAGSRVVLWSNDRLPHGSIAIIPNDGGMNSWSPPWNDYQTITDKAWGLANEVAKDIQTAFPGLYISMLTYEEYAGIPSFALEPNLMTFITTTFNNTPLTFDQQIDGLVAKGIKVGIYDFYDVWNWWYDKPFGVQHDKIRALPYYALKGATVFTAEAADNWGARGLDYYLASKTLWDPSLSLDSLLTDFYANAFGPAQAVMKHYYETRDASANAVGLNFRDLAQAESLVAGNAEYLERIRQMEYYERFLWFYHVKGVPNLTLNELKGFYTFLTKIRNLYLVTYEYDEQVLRDELKTRGLTDADVDALQNFTPPTATEAASWLAEALAAFPQLGPQLLFINPLYLNLVPLGDTSKPVVGPLLGGYRAILIPSQGGENITISVKGNDLGNGAFKWYNPYGIQASGQILQTAPNWTSLTFHADVPGNYMLETPEFPGWAYYVDVPNRAASILASKDYESAWVWDSQNQLYFDVPQNTGSFAFGIGRSGTMGKNITGKVIDANGNTAQNFNVNTETTWQFDNPVAGVWKVVINQTTGYTSIPLWLQGIPPLVWHDPRYLLVESAGSNNPPVASNQSVTTNEDTSVSITLSASDPDGNPLTYSVVANPTHGSLSGTPPALTYTPALNYNGSDTFTFRANDGTVNSNTATVTITVTAVNDPPVANNQSVTTNEDASVGITLSASDLDGNPLTYSIVANPTHASLSGTPPALTYTPALNYNGSDTFTFRANDGTVNSSTATVSITVSPANDPPVANNQSVTTNEDTSVGITLSAADPDGNPLTYSIVANPAHGSLSGTPPALTYTPGLNYNGSDTFTFRANDGTANSNTATVSIIVNVPSVAGIADVNRDGAVNILDVITVTQHWGESGTSGWIPADVNNDGKIDVLDITLVGQNWTG